MTTGETGAPVEAGRTLCLQVRPIVVPSEAETSLQFDHTSGISTLCLPELRITGHAVVADDGRRIRPVIRRNEREQVELVEDVVEVGANIDARAFSPETRSG